MDDVRIIWIGKPSSGKSAFAWYACHKIQKLTEVAEQ